MTPTFLAPLLILHKTLSSFSQKFLCLIDMIMMQLMMSDIFEKENKRNKIKAKWNVKQNKINKNKKKEKKNLFGRSITIYIPLQRLQNSRKYLSRLNTNLRLVLKKNLNQNMPKILKTTTNT